MGWQTTSAAAAATGAAAATTIPPTIVPPPIAAKPESLFSKQTENTKVTNRGIPMFNPNQIISKTVEEAEELIKGLDYKLQVNNGTAWRQINPSEIKILYYVLKDEKIVSYEIR
ncbi:hypothetical protein [Nostoc sp. FACHB-133]|uniref:hypothetical protein n=1 Tax=Nostoc sp. FACHB-133 TaxID=2692835 RepID=UPI0016846923|nr:hypothetical protein [Nostoc sp. FACHB-133]MBD2527888.1 hypothetical protein [Nostoc sp. FACHB-133]